MSYRCSQCDFTAQFESALTMHRQLHHEGDSRHAMSPMVNKSHTLPRDSHTDPPFSFSKGNRTHKSLGRTTSATRLFDKLRARLSKSKILFSHPEEGADVAQNDLEIPSTHAKQLKNLNPLEILQETQNEIFSCHLCSFDADRITVLDRHLLNDHKIGLDNLLKLVMAKTKIGLTDDDTTKLSGKRQSYYTPSDHTIEDGEFIIETVTPKIKFLKHAGVNTDLIWTDITGLEDCKMISEEIEKIKDVSMDENVKESLLVKMQTLNEYMGKFVDSSNTIKKVLSKEFSQKSQGRSAERQYFDLALGDQDSPRNSLRAHSENLEKNRNRLGENRSDKKYSSESFYF